VTEKEPILFPIFYRVCVGGILLLSSLFFTSCVIHQDYPSGWDSLIRVEKNKCPDIAGTYIDLGEVAEGKYPRSFSRLLFPNEPIGGTHVQIMQHDETMEVSVWSWGNLVRKRLYSKANKEYSCSSEGIEIPFKEGYGGEGFELGMGWGKLCLTKSADGSLIMNKKGSAAGVVLIIPVVGYGSGWYRFKQANLEELSRLISSPAACANPSFSPDGGYIVFQAEIDGNTEIFMSQLDGTEIRNLTQNPSADYQPIWSPDGTWILFISKRDGQEELYRINLDGSGLTRLTDDPFGKSQVQWSPDGKNIVFSRYIKGKGHDIIIVCADGSNQKILVEKAFSPRWSSDGQWILYHGKEGIQIIHPDGSGNRKIGDGMAITWTLDSKAIFYSPPRGGADKPRDIYLMNIDGTGKKKCLENVDTDRWLLSSIDSRRFWDPSGRRLVLSVNRMIGVQGGDGIVILSREGEIIADYREKERYFRYGGSVSWSSDGKTILFSKYPFSPGSWERYESGIYIMKDDGTEIKRIITCR